MREGNEPGYFYAPGMYHPLWWVGEHAATNLEADDFGDPLTVEEFHQYFPQAKPITREQADKVLKRIREIRQ